MPVVNNPRWLRVSLHSPGFQCSGTAPTPICLRPGRKAHKASILIPTDHTHSLPVFHSLADKEGSCSNCRAQPWDEARCGGGMWLGATASQQMPDPSPANHIFHPLIKPFRLETGLVPVFARSWRGILLPLWDLLIGMEVCAARRPEVESASAETGGSARSAKESF